MAKDCTLPFHRGRSSNYCEKPVKWIQSAKHSIERCFPLEGAEISFDSFFFFFFLFFHLGTSSGWWKKKTGSIGVTRGRLGPIEANADRWMAWQNHNKRIHACDKRCLDRSFGSVKGDVFAHAWLLVIVTCQDRPVRSDLQPNKFPNIELRFFLISQLLQWSRWPTCNFS